MSAYQKSCEIDNVQKVSGIMKEMFRWLPYGLRAERAITMVAGRLGLGYEFVRRIHYYPDKIRCLSAAKAEKIETYYKIAIDLRLQEMEQETARLREIKAALARGNACENTSTEASSISEYRGIERRFCERI